VVYCEECLAASVLPGGAGPAAADAPNPGVALALGFIPGVGAIYNGEYGKAIIQLLVFGGLIAMADAAPEPFEAMFGLGAFGFYVFMVIDSFRTAKLRAAGQAPAGDWGLGAGTAAPIGPVILIVLGVLFLFNQLDLFNPFYLLHRFWPLILIGVGAWLLWKRTAGAQSPASKKE
ncbi:MAG: LiaI-LiaF-like domain-containing protein, partial [Terriglobia bacterium]